VEEKFDKERDNAERHWREVLAQDHRKFELENRTDRDDYKARLASQKAELEKTNTESKETLVKEREEFEVEKREALKLASEMHSTTVQHYEFRLSSQQTEIEKWRGEWATKETELTSLLAEKDTSLTAAENQKIDLATSRKRMEEDLESLKGATAKERQFAAKTVVKGNRIPLTLESSVKGKYVQLGGTARQIHGGKARITRMCSPFE
jgi:hypothetical protein